jgi:prolyl oligopeptidase
VDEYHGTKVADPYRYFENLSDPEVQAWFRGQAEYARRQLDAIPGRKKLLERIAELDTGAPYRIRVIRRWPDGSLTYLKRMAGENIEKLYYRHAASGQERLLVDPEAKGRADALPEGVQYSIEFAVPSPDRTYVAYGLAAAGSEDTTLRVLHASAGEDSPVRISRIEVAYNEPSWLPDSKAFVYSRRRDLPAGTPATDKWKLTAAHLHKLGTNPDEDPVVFGKAAAEPVPMAETDFPSVFIPPGSDYAVGKIKHGDATELTLYAAPTESLTKNEPVVWEKVCDVGHAVKDYAVRGNDVYLLSAKDAGRYKVVRTSLRKPDFARGEVVVPQGDAVVESVAAAKDALYVGLLEGGVEKVLRLKHERGAKPQALEPPAGEPSAQVVEANSDCDGTFIATSSWTRAGRLYAYDPRSKTLTDTGLRPQGKFDNPQGIESAEVMVTSHDGVRVPLSIVYKSGLKRDGTNPTLVQGYGAYGFTTSANFNPVNLAWLERGGVLAFAHVRGGGTFGKEWHLAGQKATKPNTWKDFIACCEYLVRERYTSPGKLAGKGTSAGGVLIGRAVTERPDLFAAAVMNVGLLDCVRAETTTNGVPNIAEFGTVAMKEGFDGLLAMSAYHHVKDGAEYPAVLLVHGINDPRVEPWMSAKMAARLQAASASGKPVLFRVDYAAGHGIGSTRKQRQEQTADEWAFLLAQMGVASPTRD